LLTRLVICRVRPEARARFEDGQRQWGVLSGVPGFQGLVGGWRTDVPNQAVLAVFWDNPAALRRFMGQHYVMLVHRLGLHRATLKTVFSDWNLECSIDGCEASLGLASAKAHMMRVVRCGIKPGQVLRFLDSQRTVWNPGLREVGGYLGGCLSSGLEQRSDFLTTMFWTSADDHQRYLDGPFTELYTRSGLGGDTTWLEGMRVEIEPGWTVPGIPSA